VSREVVFEVDALGKVHADAQGFVGTACEEALKSFDLLTGGDSEWTAKPELWEGTSMRQTEREQL